MTHLYTNVRILLLAVTFAGVVLAAPMGCSVTQPDPMESVTPPSPAELVITAEDTAQLGPDHHLVLDLGFGSYRIDPSAGPVDLRYLDVLEPVGRVEAIEQLITRIVDTGDVARGDLEGGFSVRALGDQVQLFGSIAHGTTRIERCYLCACNDSACVCQEISCKQPEG